MPRETLRISPAGWALLSLSLTLFCAGASAAVVTAATNLARRLAPLENLSDVYTQSFIMMAAYIAQYLVLGSVFEGTHPAGALSSSLAVPALSRRRVQVGHEITAGILSLAITVALAVLWMYAGEPRSPFFAYFVTHEWTPVWGVVGLVAYVACFDTWFYFSHLALHEIDWVWHNIHYFHHQYKEPSAFAQFAVHPFEAALQGPVGHFLVQLVCPVHPIQLALMGFLSSAWAFAAHDGRGMDFNHHTYHHSKGRGRKHYFNLGFLTPFWDVVMGTRWTEDHPLWVQWKKDGTVYDTRDGTPGGVSNDAFGAYVEGGRDSGKVAAAAAAKAAASAGAAAATTSRAPPRLRK